METLALHTGYIVLGLLGLFYGGNWLVQGASRLASSFGVSTLVIGLTVVAFGTSMPELLVSLTALWQGVSGVSLGNIIGSNIANIGLILGIAGMIAPLAVHSSLIKREIPMMIAVSALVFGMALDQTLAQWEGVILLGLLILYNIVVYRSIQKDKLLQKELLEF